jgi:hypothetical protein
VSGQVNITLCGSLGLFLKGMKDIDGIRKTRIVNNPVSAGIVENSKFFDALPYRWHWLEIVRLLAALDFVELKTGILANIVRKVAQAVQGVAKEGNRFHRLNYIHIDIICNKKTCKSRLTTRLP